MNKTERVLAALAFAGVALTMSGPAYAGTTAAMTGSQSAGISAGMGQGDAFNSIFSYLPFPAGYLGTVKGKKPNDGRIYKDVYLLPSGYPQPLGHARP